MNTYGYSYIASENERDNQIQQLSTYGIPESDIFIDSADKKSMQLDEAIKALGQGDQLIVPSMNRLGCNMEELIRSVYECNKKQAQIWFVQEDIRNDESLQAFITALVDSNTSRQHKVPTLSRQTIASQNNKMLGRKRVIDREELMRLKASGMSVKDIVEKTGIARSSYYNVMGDVK